ncbi:hypothetical protein KUF54_13955 [Comamonas sp. Y33R10-2]|uniref:pilus assembly protein TadG-related protein n=1 Tax=Comamonas sp. Y33R10-2 TaxID=2853257 RepID=UPI001C5C9D72|nr:pilus assembly protein TadG-related protein [Comamonas sp. Y33R10-2]QXZ09117.1 hypothetical protein KUF54_13955 [Comamonas sp. Y33R10-2]
MQSSGTGLHRARIHSQSGSVAMLGALWLMIAVICLATIDIGNVFWQKRELQKIADLAALAGASVTAMKDCSASAQQNALKNGAVSQEVKAECGNWNKTRAGATASDMFVAGQDPFNASRVQISRSVPFLFVWQATGASARTVDANAVAWRAQPAAALTIRSTLLKVDTKQSPILNAILGGLLGSSISLDAVGWNGLANTQINLLQFLDFLAPRIGLNVGDYDKLVNADVSVGVLLQVMVDAVQQSGNTASVGVQALNQLVTAALGVPAMKLKLSQLLNLQSGLDSSALDLGLNVFDLVQGAIQVGNSNSAVSAAVAVPLPGLLDLNVFLKVIEPPQLSSVGDPQLAKLDPLGPNRIYVRTAQVRLLVSVEAPVLGGLFQVIDALLKPLSPVIALLNVLLGNVDGYADMTILPPNTRLDLSLDVGGGQSYVTDYDCNAGSKKLVTSTRTALADIRLGRLGNSLDEAKTQAFGTRAPVSMAPLPVVRLDCIGCDGFGKRTPQYFGGLGLLVDTPVAANTNPQFTFNDPPRLQDEPQWKALSANNIVGSLSATVQSLNVLKELTPDPRAKPGGIQALLKVVNDVLGSLLSLLQTIISGLLSPLLDPLINVLLKALGIDLAQTEVGARLTCGVHPELVY